MQNEPSSQIKELRREVRKLRKELDLLRQIVRVTPAKKDGTGAKVQVRCSSLILETSEGTIQAILGSSLESGELALMDASGKARVQLGASGLSILSPSGEEAVTVGAEGAAGRVVVFNEGKPRAVLKSTSSGGCVSVLHDDGRPRASLLSTQHDGADLLMITPDLKPGVRISSGALNGGLITVHRTNGSPAVSLMCGQSSAGVAIRNAAGRLKIVS